MEPPSTRYHPRYGYSNYPKGDLNTDGSTSILDMVIFIKNSLRNYHPDSFREDLDRSGTMNLKDLNIIRDIILEK